MMQSTDNDRDYVSLSDTDRYKDRDHISVSDTDSNNDSGFLSLSVSCKADHVQNSALVEKHFSRGRLKSNYRNDKKLHRNKLVYVTSSSYALLPVVNDRGIHRNLDLTRKKRDTVSGSTTRNHHVKNRNALYGWTKSYSGSGIQVKKEIITYTRTKRGQTQPGNDTSKTTRKEMLGKYSQMTEDLLVDLDLSDLEQLDTNVRKDLHVDTQHQLPGSEKSEMLFGTIKGLDGQPVNMTEEVKFWRRIKLRKQLNRDAEWAYVCMVLLIVLTLWSLWFMGGCRRCRRPTTNMKDFKDDGHLMDIIEVLWRKRKYLPMFLEPEVEEIVVLDRR